MGLLLNTQQKLQLVQNASAQELSSTSLYNCLAFIVKAELSTSFFLGAVQGAAFVHGIRVVFSYFYSLPFPMSCLLEVPLEVAAKYAITI